MIRWKYLLHQQRQVFRFIYLVQSSLAACQLCQTGEVHQLCKWRKLVNKFLIAVCMFFLSGPASSQETEQPQAPWTLLDQFDQAYTLDDQLQILLVARSMDGAGLVSQALEDKPEGYLEQRKAIFLADVSQMPAVISTLFAIPAMRDYNYRVLLDKTPRVVPSYPGDTDKVLWVEMRQGKVISQREYADPAALEQALEQAEQ